MANAPGPTVVDIQYHNLFGVHVQRLHVRGWVEVSVGFDLGQVSRWSDDGLIDLEDMVRDLVTKEADFYDDDTFFDVVTVLTQATPTSVLVPQVSKALGIQGTVVTGFTWSKAVQVTNVWRTADNGIAKIVNLDCESLNDFDAVRILPGSGALFDINGLFTDNTLAWQGQDDSKPATFIGQFKTLNEALRKHYRMV